jgi:hypothetical protein
MAETEKQLISQVVKIVKGVQTPPSNLRKSLSYTLHPDCPQHTHPAACVIAHHSSSTAFF